MCMCDVLSCVSWRHTHTRVVGVNNVRGRDTIHTVIPDTFDLPRDTTHTHTYIYIYTCTYLYLGY